MANDLAGAAGAHADDKRALLLRKLRRERGLDSDSGAEQGIGPELRRRPPGLDRVVQSCAQQRLWFLDRLAPGNPFYTVSVTIPVHAQVNLRALQAALDELVRRHETLRTTFGEEEGRAWQAIAPAGPAALEVIDLSGLPMIERLARAEALCAAESARSFDLESGPLMVARLVTLQLNEHRLLLTLHHIVCDGWSLRVLSQELLALYSAYATRTVAALAELPIQYADFSLWQHQLLAGPALERQLNYWRCTLENAPELALIPDRARPAVPSFRGGLVALTVGPRDAAAITRLSSESSATPFVVLMAAYMVLLARLSGQDDFMVGTPIAGRTRPQLEPLIGFFVNTLVLRARLDGAPSFRTLVERVRLSALDAFSHQDLPFERLVEELAPQRVLGRNPLFQVIFQLFSAQDGARGSDAPPARARGTAKFDLRLDMWPSVSGYAGELEYSEDVFEGASAARMARQFLTLLGQLLAAPDRPVQEASAMDALEIRSVTETFNARASDYPADIGIAQLFTEVARRSPAAPALEFADAALSYEELDRAADAFAHRLATLGVGVGRGAVVGVLLERSAAMIVAWLGILKLGASYLPVDGGQPAPRLRAMLDDAGACLMLASPATRVELDGIGVPLEIVDGAVLDAAPDTAAGPWPEVGGAEIATLMFTSGSTGRPKGARLPHRGIARLARGTDWNSWNPGERVASAANPAFDASNLEVWSALLNGCTLVDIAREVLMTPELLERHLADARIDHLFLTTALFIRHAAERPAMFKRLRSLTTGGARSEPASFRAVLAAGAPGRLLHAYGPTETSVLATVATITSVPEYALSVPIGVPINNSSCHVLDAGMRPLPVGVPGQLYIGGPGVADGYANQAALSARQFVDDPWRAGGRLYASGDKVRWRGDGQLEFLGRYDDQLKLRGLRVEPDEIAAAIATHEAVRAAVVAVHAHGGDAALDDDKSLVAYVELHDQHDGAADAAASCALVAHWRALYDTVLYDSPAADPTFNTSGWNDSASGAALGPDDMQEQVDQTVQRALASGARRVLEIGCGTGLLLFRLAPHCTRYTGTDLSGFAIEHVRATAAGLPALAHLELHCAAATELDALAPGQFDLVLLNSVVQYFPSVDYLAEVLACATARLAPGGSIYLGDLRHLGLLPAFHADVLLSRAADDTPASALAAELARRVDEEQELALAPAALAALCERIPGLEVARIELKRGHHQNELSRFRFDAVLKWQASALPAPHPLTRAWEIGLDDDTALRAAVRAAGAAGLRITGVPNARVCAARAAARLLAAAPAPDRAALGAALSASVGVDPERFWRLGEQQGLDVQVLFDADDEGRVDVVLLPVAPPCGPLPELSRRGRRSVALQELASQPLRGHFLRTLAPALKAHVAGQLPRYLWPDHYVLVKQLPLTRNGKIDKARLVPPPRLRPQAQLGRTAASSDTERALAQLWAGLLNVDLRGVHEHFFDDLGGHSLLATQVMSRVRSRFGIELPLRTIFEGPTVAALAAAIDAARAAPASTGPQLRAADPASGDGVDVDALDEAELDALLERMAEQAP